MKLLTWEFLRILKVKRHPLKKEKINRSPLSFPPVPDVSQLSYHVCIQTYCAYKKVTLCPKVIFPVCFLFQIRIVFDNFIANLPFKVPAKSETESLSSIEQSMFFIF